MISRVERCMIVEEVLTFALYWTGARGCILGAWNYGRLFDGSGGLGHNGIIALPKATTVEIGERLVEIQDWGTSGTATEAAYRSPGGERIMGDRADDNPARTAELIAWRCPLCHEDLGSVRIHSQCAEGGASGVN